jgi:3-phytase
MTLVAHVGGGHPIPRADLEGVAIYPTGPETGYIVCSSQGVNQFVLLDRQPPHSHLGTFRIGAHEGIDAVQETDGLDVTAAAVSGAYPEGFLLVQDGDNPGATQNFKLVDWREIRRRCLEAGVAPAE